MAAEDGQRLEADGVHYDHLTLSKTNVEETVTEIQRRNTNITCSGRIAVKYILHFYTVKNGK